jgi:formylglycine-generating enzyme required for sulfatase activity
VYAVEPKLGDVVENSIAMKLAYIEPGQFEMGAPEGERAARDAGKETLHQVTLTKGFYLGAYEVTQSQFQQIMGRNPSCHSKDGEGRAVIEGKDTAAFPVERVTWFDAVEFCNTLSLREKLIEYYLMEEVKRDNGAIANAMVTVRGGLGYRLPTEAEWEYACRAGTKMPFHYGDTLDGDKANVKGKTISLYRACRVGSYAPNRWGLYDMHGNVLEWCHDWFADSEQDAVDPQGPASGDTRIVRGGSFINSARNSRSSARPHATPSSVNDYVGFRIARTAR